MANFLEQPRQFNPWIRQLPLDTYAAVGLQKQMEYNSGVQKVETLLGGLSGLNMIRENDRQYLNNQIGRLTSRINEVAAADWSGAALVNQVGSLAGVIYNDPNIQSALNGTRKYLQDEQDISAAKKNGAWAAENEWVLRRQMNAWLHDPAPGATYQSAGYKPFEDVAAAVINSWKQAKPNSVLIQKPNGRFYAYETVSTPITAADGSTLIQQETRELNPDEVASQINALLTPSQREQLAISGLYHYRHNTDPGDILKLVDKHFAAGQKQYESLLAAEKLNLSLHAGNATALETINGRIAALQKRKDALAESKADYQQMALSNPDALKSSIYYEDWLRGVSDLIGYHDVSTKIVDNPAYKAQLEALKVQASLRRSLKSAGSGRGKKQDTDLFWQAQAALVLPQDEKQRQDVTLHDFKEKLLDLQQQQDQSVYRMLYRQFGDHYVNYLVQDLNEDGIAEEVYTLKPGMETEASLATAAWWDKYRKADPDLDITIRETLADMDEKRLVTSKLMAVIAGIEKKAGDNIRSTSEYSQAQRILRQSEQMPSTLIRGTEITPMDVRNYLKLRQDKLRSGISPGVGGPGIPTLPALTDAEIAGYNLSRRKLEALQSADNGKGSKSETQSFQVLTEAIRPGLSLLKKVEDIKNRFINTEVKKYQGIFNQVAITVPSAKAEQMRPIANFVQSLAANAQQTGMGGDTDWSSVREMVGEDHAAETVYGYVQDRDGNVRIRISNVDVDKGKPQEIAVDSRTARINRLYTPDPLVTTRNLLDLGEGIRTGSTFEESIPLNNGRTGRYNVRHEVENFGGRYKVKLYITDTRSPGSPTSAIPINSTLFADWNQLSGFLQTDVTERFIMSLLSEDNLAPFNANSLYNSSSVADQVATGLPSP